MSQDLGMVSIIIPVYNVDQYIEKCVHSVMNQSYKNIEIVLVNDASIDNSENICKKLASEYGNILFLQHRENRGQTITRNDGVNACHGKWMMFLDADDQLPPTALEMLVKRISDDDSDIVFAAYETYDENDSRKVYSAAIPDKQYTVEEFVSHLFDDIPLNVLTCIGSKIYRTEFVKNKKEKTPDETKTNYDAAFIIDALLAAAKVSYMNESIYHYFQRSGSITHSYREKMYSRFNFARRRMKELLLKCRCFEEKKTFFYEMKYIIIIWSLAQEVAYSDGITGFRRVFNEIRSDEQGMETVTGILTYSKVFKYKLFMWLLKYNQCRLLYFLLKLRKQI